MSPMKELPPPTVDISKKTRTTILFITHDIDEAVLLSDRVCILSGQPGQITAELTIQPPRPRNMSFALSEEFLACKRQILSLLDG